VCPPIDREALLPPSVSNGGAGCADGFCVWMLGEAWMTDSYVDLRAPGGGDIVATYRGADISVDVNSSPESLSFRLQTDQEKALFANGGLMAIVVNPDHGNWSNGFLVQP